jgi:short-subunit dehydrogenase
MRTPLLVAAVVVGALVVIARRWAAARAFRALDPKRLTVVTGASAGIGRAIALACAKRGCHIILTARDAEALSLVAADCKAAGAASVAVVKADLTKDADRAELAEAVNSAPFQLDTLVLNAGRGGITQFNSSEQSFAIARELVEINYLANVDLVRRLHDALCLNRGRVLVMSSGSGIMPVPHRAQYCASKFAVQGFFETLRMELAPKGVTVTIVCPSYVATEFHQKVLNVDGVAPARKGHFMSAEFCAERSIAAVEQGERQVLLGSGLRAVNLLRPWLPVFIDSQIARVASKSFQESPVASE